jgi:hypothetical protein
LKKLKAEFNSACQVDENSSDSDNFKVSSGGKESVTGSEDIFAEDDEETLENEEEDLLQFDFEASISAKKRAINTPHSSSANLNALAQQQQSSSNHLSSQPALVASTASSTATSKPPNEDLFAVDSCDKEKLEVMNKKKKEFAFDMFADDDNDFENVIFILPSNQNKRFT